MKQFGTPGDRWSLLRVLAAMVLGTLLFGALGYLFDLVIGPLIGQHGWWTVTGLGGTIAGATAQAVREFSTPIGGPIYAPSASADRANNPDQ